jgi:hypothetical protein
MLSTKKCKKPFFSRKMFALEDGMSSQTEKRGKKEKHSQRTRKLHCFQKLLRLVPVNGKFGLATGIFAFVTLLYHVNGDFACLRFFKRPTRMQAVRSHDDDLLAAAWATKNNFSHAHDFAPNIDYGGIQIYCFCSPEILTCR